MSLRDPTLSPPRPKMPPRPHFGCFWYNFWMLLARFWLDFGTAFGHKPKKKKQKDVKIDIDFINDANHNFTNHLDDLMDVVKKYLNQRYDNFIDTFHEENFI